MQTAADIVSITTGRETILIGPLSSFGLSLNSPVLRERHSIFTTLQFFLSRPNAEELIRPYMRRWGVDPVSLHGPTRHAIVEALARAAANGQIGIVKVPEVTLTFAGASLDDDIKQVSPKPVIAQQLPPDLSDRMMIVFGMVPDYMEGEAKIAFENAVKDLGMGVIVGGVCAWIGAHFIPGINIAMLAFDLFFLSSDVLHAMEKAAKIVEDVREAKSRDELEPAAIGLAAVLSVLVIHGVLSKLIKAKKLTKGVDKRGRKSSTKPSLDKKRQNRKPKDKVREQDGEGGGSKKATASESQTRKAKELGVDERWVNKDGTIKWPPNEGFDGPITEKTLKPGDVVTRYGGDRGKFFSPDGTSFGERGLPPSSAAGGERKFRVVEDIPVRSGKVAPWFDQPGGGTQYKSDMSLGDMLKNGLLEEI